MATQINIKMQKYTKGLTLNINESKFEQARDNLRSLENYATTILRDYISPNDVYSGPKLWAKCFAALEYVKLALKIKGIQAVYVRKEDF